MNVWSFSFTALALLDLVCTPAGTRITGGDGALELAIETVTDSNHPIPGAAVRIEGEQSGLVIKATGPTGQTRFDVARPGEVITLHLGRSPVPTGETLGVSYVFAAPPVGEIELSWRMSVTHPTAQDILVHAGDPSPGPLGSPGHFALTFRYPPIDGGLLAIGTTPTAEYSFTTKAAPLPTNEVIQSYFSFRQASVDLSDYEFGAVLRQSELVEVGYMDPITLQLASFDHTFASRPHADLFFFPDSPATADPEAFAHGLDVDDGFAFVELVGQLGAGDTVVLLRDGGQRDPSPVRVIDPVYPLMSLPAGSGEGGGGVETLDTEPGRDEPPALGAPAVPGTPHPTGTDCHVEPPGAVPGFSCSDPGSPAGLFDFLLDACPWEPAGEVGCTIKSVPKDKSKCVSPGEHWEGETLEIQKKTFIIPMGPGEGLAVETFEWEVETWQRGAGGYTSPAGAENRGTCFQLFEQNVVCSFLWNHPVHRYVKTYRDQTYGSLGGVRHPGRRLVGTEKRLCADSRTVMTQCESSYDSSNACGRTGE